MFQQIGFPDASGTHTVADWPIRLTGAKTALLHAYGNGNDLLAGVDNANIYEALLAEKWNVDTCWKSDLDIGYREQRLRSYDLIYGDLRFTERVLGILGIEMPRLPDYPEPLQGWLGREVWQADLKQLIKLKPPFFVKPSDRAKRFVGGVIRDPDELWSRIRDDEDAQYWVSEVVDFVAEFRVFVYHRQIAGIRPYKARWEVGKPVRYPSKWIVEAMIRAWVDQPVAWGLDVGIDDCENTVLVEVNDHLCLGSYDFDSKLYLRGCFARWREVLGEATDRHGRS